MQASYILFDLLQFLSPKYGRWHLGEGLFFPMIKQHMNLYGFGVVYLTRMEMHTFVLMLHSSYKQGSCFSLLWKKMLTWALKRVLLTPIRSQGLEGDKKKKEQTECLKIVVITV